MALLNEALNRRLTVLSAPAGYGKSTLLSEWQASLPQDRSALAWVSLDDADNDPVRFWAYVITAMNQLSPDVGTYALNVLYSSAAASLESAVVTLINALAERSTASDDQRDIILVLDDYHVLTTQAIHQSVTFLLDYLLPHHIHLVIATRNEPPLPLARFRARGQLSEIQTSSLCFTLAEATIFFNQALGLTLSAADIAVLEARTEGWVAGLQLAALSLQQQPEPTRWLQAFTGSHQFISDFLLEEVLEKQAPQIQDFLLQTSLLQRLSADLCNAVTMRDDSAQLLEQLEAANLFLIPLDQDRRWYRYHALFQEALRKKLQRTLPTERMHQLHLHAAAWYEQHGFFPEAIEHALAGKDMELAGRLLEHIAPTLWRQGQWGTLLGWLEQLPEDGIRTHPPLCLSFAWVLIAASRLQEAERYLDLAKHMLEQSRCHRDCAQQSELQPGAELVAEMLTLRATIARIQDCPARTITYSHQALEFVAPENAILRSIIALNLGHAYRLNGATQEGIAAFRESITQAQVGQSVHTALLAMNGLAELLTTSGALHQASQQLEEAIAFAEQQGARYLPQMCLIHIKKGELCYEWNDLTAASQHVQRGLQLGLELGEQHRTVARYLVRGYLAQARIASAQGQEAEALAQVARATALMRASQLPPLSSLLAATYLRLWTLPESAEAVARWAEQRSLTITALLDVENERTYLTFARYLLLMGRVQDAQTLLERLQQGADDGGRTGRSVEILILRALAAQALSLTSEAILLLQQALALAEPGGYTRLFIDEGRAMATLLAKLVEMRRQRKLTTQATFSWAHVKKLLAILQEGKEAASYPAISPEIQADHGPLQLLSEREMEILSRIARGLSNQEIARDMVIELSTVKSHLKHIYRKLNVESRTQAVALAKQLDML